MVEGLTAIGHLPIVVLTGCLGAGKTTLLNRLLAQPAVCGLRPAIMVNEFGPLGIDGRLIKDGPYKKFELNNGSVFCECLRPQLMDVLADIASSRHSIVLVEASGVSDPADLETVIGASGLAGKFRIQAELCVVDAVNFVKTAAFMAIADRQATTADAIVINKTDLVSQAEINRLEKILHDMNPSAKIKTASHGDIDWEFIARLRHKPAGRGPVFNPSAAITAVSISTDRRMDWLAFQSAVEKLGERLLRLKGLADFGQGGEFVEFAGQNLTCRPADQAVKSLRGITVIAWKTTADEIRAAFDQAFTADYPQED